jgi:hypothetical protein
MSMNPSADLLFDGVQNCSGTGSAGLVTLSPYDKALCPFARFRFGGNRLWVCPGPLGRGMTRRNMA